MKKTIYIDVTDALLNNLNTGIQRVVRNIASRPGLIEELSGCAAIPVIIKNNRLFRADIGAIPRTPWFLHGVKGFFVRAEAATKRFFPEHGVISRHGNGFKREKDPVEGNPVSAEIKTGGYWGIARNLLKKIYVKMNLACVYRRSRSASMEEFFPGEGDVVFFPDVFWTSFYDINEVISTYKNRGAKTAVLVHDLIPIRCSGRCESRFAAMFKKKLDGIARQTDLIFTISGSEKINIERYLKELGISGLPVEFFYPGADFGGVERSGGADKDILNMLRNKFPGIFKPGILILMVGTIIPTKNHPFVVKAFERLRAEGLEAKLILIGKYDASPTSIISIIKNSHYFGKSLFLCGTVSDEELESLYGVADALVIASEAEGFGLPIIEGAVKGIPVVASDIPVFREIGAKLQNIYYFTLGDENSLISAIKEVAAAGRSFLTGEGSGVAGCPWIGWDESVSILSVKLGHFAGCQRQPLSATDR